MKKTIAVIEDDTAIAELLDEVLLREGYRVLHAYSGTEARYLFREEKPDLALLDLMLPGIGGEEVLALLSGLPVIILSAKTGIDDKIRLLRLGAADYVTKPFHSGELLARIEANLRKAGNTSGEWLNAGDLRLNLLSREACTHGLPLRLTRTEYAVLKLLMQHSGQVVTRSALLGHIALDTPDCTENSLRQHLSNLRRKLREAGSTAAIESVWGIGFRLES